MCANTTYALKNYQTLGLKVTNVIFKLIPVPFPTALPTCEQRQVSEVYTAVSYNVIVAFLENTALWKNRVIETIGSI
jgi:hypothetical protein